MEGGGEHAALVDQPQRGAGGRGDRRRRAGRVPGPRRRPELVGALTIEQFPRGYSNLTYLVAGRRTRDRAAPAAARRRHQAAHTTWAASTGSSPRSRRSTPKAPRPLAYCEDPSVLGAPFYLMERVRGVILRGGAAAAALSGPSERQAISEVAGRRARGAARARPSPPRPGASSATAEGYVERQVKGWTARYEAARTGDVPAMDRVAPWLDAHRPPASDPPPSSTTTSSTTTWSSIRRGLDRVVAVLDWEMATVGDPLMDLGTHARVLGRPGRPARLPRRRVRGASRPSPAACAAARSPSVTPRATGRDLARLPFYYAFGLFKVAVIAQQIYARFRQGHTRDPRFAHLDAAVAACAATAARVAETGRIDGLGD